MNEQGMELIMHTAFEWKFTSLDIHNSLASDTLLIISRRRTFSTFTKWGWIWISSTEIICMCVHSTTCQERHSNINYSNPVTYTDIRICFCGNLPTPSAPTAVHMMLPISTKWRTALPGKAWLLSAVWAASVPACWKIPAVSSGV